MFVDIEDPKSPLKVANILTAYDKGVVIKGVRQPKEKLTPEVCFDILKSTNHPRCIRDVLQLIAKLPEEEQAQFKEVVLACFDNREQPEPILQLGQDLAEKSGYGIEFAKLKKIKDGEYLFSAVDARKCLMCLGSEFKDKDFSMHDKVIFGSDKKIQFGYNVKFPKSMEFPNSSDVSFYNEEINIGSNLKGVQSIRFKDGAKVSLKYSYFLPPQLDVSMCAEVDLSECYLNAQSRLCFKDGAKVVLVELKNLPANLDFSPCSEINLEKCDLSNQPNLSFRENAIVDLKNAENLPENLDFSRCDEVDLSHCDLSKQPNLRFKEGAKVALIEMKNLPPNLDVSSCVKVDLSYGYLADYSNLSFKEGAIVNLSYAKSLPKNLDLSHCDEVNLSFCDLKELPNLRFKKGAKVTLTGSENLSPHLDLSQCDEVNLSPYIYKRSFDDGRVLSLSLKFTYLVNPIDVSQCRKIDLSFCDLSNQSNLRFKDGAEVDLEQARHLPPNLDVSHCSSVKLTGCDLSEQANLCFNRGAKVNLKGSKNLSGRFDVSMCDVVYLDGCDLSSVKELIFKDREQMEESRADLPKDWNGKLVFIEEQQPSSLGLSMFAKTKGGR